VEADRREQSAAEPPENRRRRLEEGRVLVDLLRPRVELEVPDHVDEDEAEEDETGQGHQRLQGDGAERRSFRGDGNRAHFSFSS
jgi:hypothetical protein